jgi:hypothetical protein
MKRALVYRPSAQRELAGMQRSDAVRIVRALEQFAATGSGDVKALKGPLTGRYRLRVGKYLTGQRGSRLIVNHRGSDSINPKAEGSPMASPVSK